MSHGPLVIFTYSPRPLVAGIADGPKPPTDLSKGPKP